MKNTKKPFYSVHPSKTTKGTYRLVQWHGKHPNVTIETLFDGISYGKAIMKKEELEKEG